MLGHLNTYPKPEITKKMPSCKKYKINLFQAKTI